MYQKTQIFPFPLLKGRKEWGINFIGTILIYVKGLIPWNLEFSNHPKLNIYFLSVECPRYSVHTFDMPPSCNVTITATRKTRRCVNLFRVCRNQKKNLKYLLFFNYHFSPFPAAQTSWSPVTSFSFRMRMIIFAEKEMSCI